MKALTYGNLGTGGLSKAAFEQKYPDFEPGYGTHTVEHRAIDAAGNIGPPREFRATVLPGASPACTTTITGKRKSGLIVKSGVTCIAGATIQGVVTVQPGASLVVSDGSSSTAGCRQSTQRSCTSSERRSTATPRSRAAGDVIIAGSEFHKLVINGNKGSSYGVAIVGNRIADKLLCNDNDPGVTDFGAPNDVGRKAAGDCAGL